MEIKENVTGPSNGRAAIGLTSSHTPDLEYEIEEIISHRPPFFVRWGTLIFFGMLLFLGFIAWKIRYPDIVIANGTLNSINAPKEVIAKTEGKLVRLFPVENEQVAKGDVLGYIESTARHEEVISLSDSFDIILDFIQKNKTDELINYVLPFSHLGELQSSFQVYMQSFQDFTNYLSNGYYLKRKRMLRGDVVYLLKKHAVLLEQKNILSQDLLLADSTFQANGTLRRQGVISSVEYRNEKSKMLAKEMTLPQLASSIVDNESLQHEKQKEIAELENRILQQKGIFIQALNTFKSQVEEWKKKYLLLAPVGGRVSFASFLQENQQVKAGQLILFINPGNADYYVEARIPQYNFGKVKIGEPVLLKFDAYPYQEFGVVRGNLAAISTIPTDSGYIAKIILPSGLITNYGKTIQYRNGLSIQAQIVTQNKRLLQRLFENVIRRSSR